MDPSSAYAPALAETSAKSPSAWWAAVITLVGWLILAVPAYIALFLTAAPFSGCFLECATPKPQPGAGMAGVIILAAMVAGWPRRASPPRLQRRCRGLTYLVFQ